MATISILGSHIGGLAAAARLRVKGHTVTIHDDSPQVAPQLATMPNRLTLPAALRDLFLKTGSGIDELVTLRECDIAYRARISYDTGFDLPGFGVSATTQAIEQSLGKAAAREWNSSMRRAAQEWMLLHKQVENYRGYVDVLTKMSSQSWWKRPTQGLRHEQLITIRDASPFHTEAPVLRNLMPYIAATFGVYSIEGGLPRLGHVLRERCENLGVEFHLGSPIDTASISSDLVVIADPDNIERTPLSQHLKAGSMVRFDMTTNKSNVFVVGESTYPGPGLSFSVLSAAMLANLIGSA